ncbi:DNA/RNA polymerase, partial [Exidia glandulosa HHB12029]
TISAYPLPRPPASEFENLDAVETIRTRPDLFKIVTPINPEHFRQLLQSHPNQPYVHSVYLGLIEGFWPLADTRRDNAPTSADYSSSTPWTGDKLAFFEETCKEEVDSGRWSEDFGPDLLPGMYSSPIFAVPKPHTSKFRMVVDHSSGTHSLNSFISREGVATKLDSVRDLGHFLRVVRSKSGRKLRLIKSDGSKAYRRAPAHPLWQIKQVISVNGSRRIDRCCNFGTKSAGDIWFAIIALVLWGAQFVRGIDALLCYVDDVFSFDDFYRFVLYKPYNRLMSPKQAALLHLWDWVGIPHSDDKQVSGAPLVVIGFEVDPNLMTITMSEESRSDLIAKLEDFTSDRGPHDDGKRKLVEWQRILGHANWALNAYPLLRPGLASSYDKIRGKSGSSWPIVLNTRVIRDLQWFARTLRSASGVQLLEANHWEPEDADITIYCDASLTGLGFWCPSLKLGFAADHADHNIIRNESLCVLSALEWATLRAQKPARVALYTDSQVSVDMFDSLKAELTYNPILLSTVEIMLSRNVSARVYHIPGARNVVADALSRAKLDLAAHLAPGLVISTFIPPAVS